MANPRPTSPHLQIYTLPLTGLISISHRITGVLLSAGLVLVVYTLCAIAGGEEAYQALQTVLHNGLIQLLYWGFIFALFFHLCHGVRHLLWDLGYSFDRATLTRYALIELLASCLLTLMTLIWAG